MHTRLTLGEKLKDLRYKRDGKLVLEDVSEATGISTSTLQRLEADEDTRVGYQDIQVLARFYNVSADYLFGLTDLQQYRNIEIDELRLSDEAIAVLKSGMLNNRLISEFIAHEDFPQFLRTMEIYIDRKIIPQMKTMNAMYKFVEHSLKEHTDISDNDGILVFLQQSVIDEDGYLRHRVSERFNLLLASLFEAHKKDKVPPDQPDMFAEAKEMIETYLDTRKTEAVAKAKVIMLCKQIGLNAAHLTDEEWRVLIKTLESGKKVQRLKRRR